MSAARGRDVGDGGAVGSAPAARPAVLFEEYTPAPVWLRVVGVIAFVAAVLLVVDMTVIDPGSFVGGGAVAAVVGAVALLLVGLIAVLVRILVTVDATTVTFALSPIVRVRFDRSDVDSAKAVAMAARDFGGAGYRVLPGNKRALLFTSGPGVAVVRRSTGIHYSVRTERPAELVTALLSRRR